MKRFVKALTLLLWGSSASSAYETIMAQLRNDSHFSTLEKALNIAELADSLADPNISVTLLAPPNEAFNRAPIDLVRLEQPDWKHHLQDLLEYHVLTGEEKTKSRYFAPPQKFDTWNGEKAVVTDTKAGSVTFNKNARVMIRDVETGNGLIQVVSNVLLPRSATQTIYDYANSNPELSIILGLIDKAGIQAAMNYMNPTGMTFFLPTNTAFETLTDAQMNALQNDLRYLRHTLAYHGLEGNIVYEDLSPYNHFTSIEGNSIQVHVILNHNTKIITPDILLKNGVVHTVDGVLLPPMTPTSPAPTSSPSVEPTATPSTSPSLDPTTSPTTSPTVSPSGAPTGQPTPSPSAVPSNRPSDAVMAPTYAMNLAELIQDNGLAVFLHALQNTGLLATLEDPNEVYTVFAPTSRAFYPTFSTYLNYGNYKEHLKAAMEHQIIQGEALYKSGLIQGLVLESMYDNETITVTGSSPVELDYHSDLMVGDIGGTNGVLHVTESVLLPEFLKYDVIDIIARQPSASFGTLIYLLIVTGLVNELDMKSPMTFFAPNNDAFAELLNTQKYSDLVYDVDGMKELIKYHIVPQIVYEDDLTDGASYTTLQGSTLSFTVQSQSRPSTETLTANTPTQSPTITPTAVPTGAPTCAPTVIPSISPTGIPSGSPTGAPSLAPSTKPTSKPATSLSDLFFLDRRRLLEDSVARVVIIDGTAHVIEALSNQLANFGVVHVIDKVVIPPTLVYNVAATEGLVANIGSTSSSVVAAPFPENEICAQWGGLDAMCCPKDPARQKEAWCKYLKN